MYLYIRVIFLSSVSSMIPLLPMAALYQAVMLKNARPRPLKTPIPHILGAYLFCFCLLSIFAATAMPNLYELKAEWRISLTPFASFLQNPAQYIENIFLFVPLGFLLPMLWKKFERKSLAFLSGALLSLFIEVMQIFTIRLTDIDDLLMNTLGTVAGYFLFAASKKIFPKIAVCSADDVLPWKREPLFYFALAWFSMFFFHPFMSKWLLRLIA